MAKTISELGSIMQLAFVPGDMDKALNYWTKVMGAGPFFSLPHVSYREVKYRGTPINLDFSILIGYWGDIQIELIEQHCDSPSIYKSWREGGLEGLHHMCLLVDDIAEARAVFANAGSTIEQEVFMDGAEAFYADTGGGPGTMIEVLEPSADFRSLFTMMREAARGWDGSDPLRSLG
jgi:methylmalonyl-CoA/ethylmalonyl-CoA epimerase